MFFCIIQFKDLIYASSKKFRYKLNDLGITANLSVYALNRLTKYTIFSNIVTLIFFRKIPCGSYITNGYTPNSHNIS